MKANVGGLDKWARILIGSVLVGLALTGAIGLWGWIGLVPMLTGIFGYCPAYSIFGWSSCPLKTEQ
jgi:hypothetical protein